MILVTGASGKTGKAIIRALVSKGKHVKAFRSHQLVSNPRGSLRDFLRSPSKNFLRVARLGRAGSFCLFRE